MRKRIRTIAFLALGLAAYGGEPQDRLHVVVLHTNDIHGQVLTRRATWLDKAKPPEIGGLARVAAYVRREREVAQKTKTPIFVVDAGDWYQGTPEGIVDRGLVFVTALAAVGYDAMCVGNHEFDHGVANLVRILEGAKPPAVCANLTSRTSGAPVEWVEPWRIVESQGLRVAVVGLLTPVTPEIVANPEVDAIVFADPVEVFARARKDLAEKADWILPVTHLGVEADRALARSQPDLPLIVGGHSHTYLKEGVREGSTLIVQAGSKASAVGRVDLWFDRETKKVVESRAQLVDLLAEPAETERCAAVEKACRELAERSAEAMKVVVGELLAPAVRSKDPLASSSAGNLIADLLRERGRADVGLMNRGGIRTDLEAGPITRRQLFEIMPFDNALSVVTMKGRDLAAGIERAVEGTAHSGLELSGVEVEVRVDARGSRELVAVRCGGKPLDPEATFRVAMNSFMADGGDAYFDEAALAQREDDPVLIRDLLELAFVEKKTITPNVDDRYVVRR